MGGVTTSYVYDVNASLPILLDDGERKYVWGLGLAYAVDAAGSVQVYHTDGLGSVRAITDASGSVIQTYESDEFGVPIQSQGSLSQPFGYTGEQRDPESGFVYLRARTYDPATGRFLQRDPYSGSVRGPSSLNRYSYVRNNPLNLLDPSGLSPSQNRVLGDFCFRFDQDTGQVSVNPTCGTTISESVTDAPPLQPVLPIIGGPVFARPPALPGPRPGYEKPWLPGVPIVSVVTNVPIVLHRYISQASEPMGRWLTTLRPTSASVAQDVLALRNLPTHYQEVVVPAGTRIQVGLANSLWGHTGQGLQVELLQRIPPSSYGSWIPLAP